MQRLSHPYRSSWLSTFPMAGMIATVWQAWQSWYSTSDFFDALHAIINLYKDYKMTLNSLVAVGLISAAAGAVICGITLLWMKHLKTARFKQRIQELAKFAPPIPDSHKETEHW